MARCSSSARTRAISSVRARKKGTDKNMARLIGVDLPRNKRIEIALTYIYGIGLTTSKKILAETGIDPDTRTDDLTEEELVKLRDYIQANLTVEGDLRRDVTQNVKRLMEIGCYRIARACPRAASAPTRMPVPARVRASKSAARRSSEVANSG